MGWDYELRPATVKEIAAKMQDCASEGWTVGPPATKANGARLWAILYQDGQAVDVLLWLVKRTRAEWGYKGIMGSMGPHYYDCPLRMVEEVEEAGQASESFSRWAEKVRAEAERQNSQATAYGQLRPGMTVRLIGSSIPYVTITSRQKRSWLGCYNGRTYRIPKAMIGEIIAASALPLTAEVRPA